ncbi:MAG: response regulator [Acidobacteria bacterium]|nr:response regulator [Acidobacteriota bacterium]
MSHVSLLVIEDEEAIRFAMMEYFTAAGYRVDSACNTVEARSLLDGEPYAVVIVDVRLGGEDRGGLTLVDCVRARASATGIVLLTAYNSPDVEAEARRRGAHVCLQKPQPLAVVADIVSALMTRDRPGAPTP